MSLLSAYRNWEWVTSSVERCLWSGPDLDVGNIVLTATEGLKSGDKSRMLRQFSRVINAAYLKAGGGHCVLHAPICEAIAVALLICCE